jgi:hypothetical protein
MAQFWQYPTKLTLYAGEGYPTQRLVPSAAVAMGVKEEDLVNAAQVLTVEDVTAMGILVYQMTQQAQFLSTASASSTSSLAVSK